jgi:hypothetical protein
LNNQITLLTVLGFIGCSIACGGIVLVYQWYAGQIDWANNNCGSEGVVIDTWWPQVTVVKNIC